MCKKNLFSIQNYFRLIIVISFNLFTFLTQAQYSETFPVAGKGVVGLCSTDDDPTSCAIHDLCDINWTIDGGLTGLIQEFDYLKTEDIGGGEIALRGTDLNQEICWLSPTLNISGVSNVSFDCDITYAGFDGPDYLDVEYSIDGGAFMQISNIAGGGTHTIEHSTSNNNGTENDVGASNLNGSTLQIRVCCIVSASTENFTLDNVNVPQTGVTVIDNSVDPDVPTVTASPSTIVLGASSTLNIAGNLNDATQWEVYTGSCGGTNIGMTTGTTFNVTPTVTTTYFVRGEAICITTGSCGQVTVNIAEPSISASTLSQAEDVAGTLDFVIDLGGNAVANTNIEFKVSGTADDATDYTLSGTNITYDANTNTGTATILMGTSTATINVDPTTDVDIEGDETVILIIECDKAACATIVDDDPMVMMMVSQSPKPESSGQAMVFTFSRTGETSSDLIVNFSASGTASTMDDYMVMGTTSFNTGTGIGTVTIPSGNATKEIMVVPTADAKVEGDETIIMTIEPAGN